MPKLPTSYYLNPDVVVVAYDLIGKVLVTELDGIVTAGMIIETEAYCGINDKACHANNGKRTPRNEIMYHEGGHAYVYLCYGIHHLFNVVTNESGKADAVLIRGIFPLDGIEAMLQRRKLTRERKGFAQGPGAMSQAMGIYTKLNGQLLTDDTIWIEDRGIDIPKELIVASTRIGVDYAGEDALRPWRFFHSEFYPSKIKQKR
jgi:DNA-3-methyladenine glycosylase